MTENTTPETESQLEKIDLDRLRLNLWKHRSLIIASTIVFAALAVLISFLFTPLFTAEISFLPVGSKQLGVFLKSRSVEKLVLQQIPELQNLLQVTNPTFNNYALELGKCITLKRPTREDQPYTLRVVLPHATMAADVANTCMNLVASFVNTPEFDMTKRNTRFLKDQYEFYSTALRNAEAALRSFQERHGIILLDSQTAATVGLVAQIEARLVKKEIELQALHNTPENPVVKKRVNEITALKDTLNELKGEQEGLIFSSGGTETGNQPGLIPGLADAPRLRLEHQKLRREVTLAEQTCMYLQGQLITSRIQEEKEGISFMVIDHAVVPEKASHPNRPLFAFFGALLGFCMSVFRVSIQNSRIQSA